MGTGLCDSCGEVTQVKLCTGCMVVRYCSEACQRAARLAHKGFCNQARRLGYRSTCGLCPTHAETPSTVRCMIGVCDTTPETGTLYRARGVIICSECLELEKRMTKRMAAAAPAANPSAVPL